MKRNRNALLYGGILCVAAACVLTSVWAQDNPPVTKQKKEQASSSARPYGPPGVGPGRIFPTPEQMDANKDGEVSKEEFRAAWTASSKKMFAQLDADKDGILNKEELEKYPKPGQRPDGGRNPDKQAAADKAAKKGREGDPADGKQAPPKNRPPRNMGPPLPEQMDADKDGNVTQKEFDAAWQEFIEMRFSRMDADKNGTLSGNELQKGRPGPSPASGAVKPAPAPSQPAQK